MTKVQVVDEIEDELKKDKWVNFHEKNHNIKKFVIKDWKIILII